MKKLFTLLIVLALVVLCAVLLPTEAEAASVSDLEFMLNSDGKGYTVSDCSTSASGALVIPSTYNGKPVTRIGSLVFFGSSLTSVTIPDSVTTIGYSAFGMCKSLTSVTIPDSVTSIGEGAFNGCTRLTSVTIGDSVTSIGDSAFCYCKRLTSVTIGDSVTSIGNSAFSSCTSLTSVTIPDSVTGIGNSAFWNCTSLTSVTIPDSVTSIGYSAFSGCTSLTSVTIPDSVTSIGSRAFQDCTSLTSVMIPDSVTSIGDFAFYYCYSLKEVLLPKGMDTIGSNAFDNCSKLETVYHKGSQDDWDWIVINTGNDYLKNATIIHNFAGDTIPGVCNHQWQVATCTTAKTCTLCGRVEGAALGHSYSAWADAGNGKHSKTCSICKDVQTVAHTWNSGTVTKAATCKDTGIETYTCTGCKATKTETIAKLTTHTYGAWTKVNDTTHKHTCSVCQKEETANHNWNGGSVTKKATCKEDGVKTYTCTTCNAIKTEAIAKLTTHTYDNACDTSCNVCGQTRTTTHNYKTAWSKDKTNHWHECSVCKDKKDVAAHTPGAEATETSAQTCTICGYVIKAALNHIHNYVNTWTSDANGHWYACSGCEEKGSYAAHTPGPAATATTDQTCTICGYVLAEATGETEPTTQPTTTAPSNPVTTQPEGTTAAPSNPVTTQPEGTTAAPTETTDNSEPSADPTVWIIVAVAVVLLGGGAAGIIIRKKKH